jgi:hypothetical protein
LRLVCGGATELWFVPVVATFLPPDLVPIVCSRSEGQKLPVRSSAPPRGLGLGAMRRRAVAAGLLASVAHRRYAPLPKAKAPAPTYDHTAAVVKVPW